MNNRNYLTISLVIFIVSLLYSTNIFILLTTFVFPGAILSNYIIKDHLYYLNILFLEICLLLVFSCENLITFYIFFEAALIPLFIIMIRYGGVNNQRAAYLLFLYTLLGSLLILVGFIILFKETGTIYITNISLISIENSYIFFFIFISLIVKTPFIPLHIWLPRAHSEASVSNSIILAGLILKIATFGYLRLLLEIIPFISLYYAPIIEIFAIISLFYSSLSCLRQIDTKAFVAFSSIAHISIIVFGLFSNNLYGIYGGLILSIGHGLISPILFFIIGGILYDRFHTRIIRYFRGISTRIPLICLFFFFCILGNLGLPLTINFLGEILSLLGLFKHNPFYASLCSLTVVFSACYSLWFFCRISFGSYSPYLLYASDLNRREFHILLPWFLITILFGVYTTPFNSIFIINHSYILNYLSFLLY